MMTFNRDGKYISSDELVIISDLRRFPCYRRRLTSHRQAVKERSAKLLDYVTEVFYDWSTRKGKRFGC